MSAINDDKIESARISTAESFRSALAMELLCFWPPERVTPRSPQKECCSWTASPLMKFHWPCCTGTWPMCPRKISCFPIPWRRISPSTADRESSRISTAESFRSALAMELLCFWPPERVINLHIRPGEMLGILGRTGSGKSSLADLLLRVYDCEKGNHGCRHSTRRE